MYYIRNMYICTAKQRGWAYMAGIYSVCVSYGVSSAVVELSVSLMFLIQKLFQQGLVESQNIAVRSRRGRALRAKVSSSSTSSQLGLVQLFP